MCNANNHPPGCTCGWGGEGSSGGYGASFYHHQLSSLAVMHGKTFLIPVDCWYCGQPIYIYANRHGSVVLFDDLGRPWPKHQCLQAPAWLGDSSSLQPARFLSHIPVEQFSWFHALVDELSDPERHLHYVTTLEIPAEVLADAYEQRFLTIQLLKALSNRLKLPAGLHVPSRCRKCRQAILIRILDDRVGVFQQSWDRVLTRHSCFSSLPATLSRRDIFTALKASENEVHHWPPLKQPTLGFIAGRTKEGMLFRSWPEGEVRAFPGHPPFPLCTLISVSPDGKVHLITSTSSDASASSKSAGRSKNSSTVQRGITPYPNAMKDPALQKVLSALLLEHMPKNQVLAYTRASTGLEWHIGGRIAVRDAAEFVRLIELARDPARRTHAWTELTRLGETIARKLAPRLAGLRR
ncbi:hypothetical protein [Deinococcus aquiradiocola]|uniref:Uncharacterized protein n=1 Tax=Deinococcus aquiradiocola TaxID=393059 RepID=A0A917PCV2_9DEIO|nr:hypothetical protein [Deinococcus aquiradiocola]GGJ71296.1 hypothetical protein GCM10008939_14590 [Deinococcus aquiradiocola]